MHLVIDGHECQRSLLLSMWTSYGVDKLWICSQALSLMPPWVQCSPAEQATLTTSKSSSTTTIVATPAMTLL